MSRLAAGRGRSMNCLEVRDRLPEFALGVLTSVDARDVERHLEWCAGCRKEVAELQDGAGLFGLSLPPADPPLSLEEKVVSGLAVAAGRWKPATHHRFRVLVASTLAALMVALGAFGWALAERNRAADLEKSAAEQIQQIRGVVTVLRSFGARPYEAQLTSPRNDSGTYGSAAIFSSPKLADFILINVVPPADDRGPYTVQLLDETGRVVSGGTLTETNNSPNLIFYESSGKDLSKGRIIVVRDALGLEVLTGQVHPATHG